MLTVKNTEVMNFKNAMRGARNPMNSWDRSDSYSDDDGKYILGENDLSLAVRLRKAGSDHRKFLRQIFVSMDIAILKKKSYSLSLNASVLANSPSFLSL